MTQGTQGLQRQMVEIKKRSLSDFPAHTAETEH
jgi:hypothetical protein